MSVWADIHSRSIGKQTKKEDIYQQWWRGVEGIVYIDHGEWADPELEYKGKRFNYWSVEEIIWNASRIEYGEGKSPLIDEVNMTRYCKIHADEIKEFFFK